MTRALGPRASVTAGAGPAWAVLAGGTTCPFGMTFVADILRGRIGAGRRASGGLSGSVRLDGQ